MIEPKVRCKCTVCGATQMVRISELLTGSAKCFRGISLNRHKCCEGELNYYSDDFEDAMLNVNALMQFLRFHRFENVRLGELVDTVADDIGAWAEGEQSPRDMGWVNDKGLP